jgi:signal transduction histidine kinase
VKFEDREFDVEISHTTKRLLVSVLPLVLDKKVQGSLVSVEDVTEKRNREARLRRIENLASLTTLAAGVAHEIKNPLGSISIHIQLARKMLAASRLACEQRHESASQKNSADSGQSQSEDEADAPDPIEHYDKLAKYLDVVEEEIERLNRIVVDFLFTVRPMNLDCKFADINKFLSDMVEFVHYELDDAGIVYKLELDPLLPQVFFDEQALKMAVLNLLKNAKEAMKEGDTLEVATKSEDGHVKITISDTGCGIPEEKLGKIFEPYWTTKHNGSGLGLLAVFKVVREHSGEITVTSKAGKGTRFVISLPLPNSNKRLLGFKGGPR